MTGYQADRPSVCLVLLNYNAWDKTLACLASIKASTIAPDAIVLVDNASSEDRSALILRQFPGIEFIRNSSNLGFAKGMNVGIRRALESGADYLWLLNNDTVVSPDALELLIKRAGQAPDIAITGGCLKESRGRQGVQSLGGGQVNLWLGIARHCKDIACIEKLDYVNGANMLLRRRAMEEVGLFDEHYFMYWEDVDLSMRMRNAGWQLAVAPDAVVHHEVSGTIGRTSASRRHYYLSSAKRFLRRYSPFPPLAVLVCWSVQMLIALKTRSGLGRAV